MCRVIFLELEANFKDIHFGSVIGRGSFAVVHKGSWKGIEVALKRIQLPVGSDISTFPTPKEVTILKLVVYRILVIS